MPDHPLARSLVRGALRAAQAVAAHAAQPLGHRPNELRRHTRHDLLKAGCLARYVRHGDRVLDVGSGDGRRLEALGLFRDIEPMGLEVQSPPPDARVALQVFDGAHIPFETGSFDVVLLCYVLHHLEPDHAQRLLGEARRVARREVLLLEDSKAAWTLPYRVRNFMHRVECDLAYGAATRRYRSPGGERMFLTHDEWRAFLGKLPDVGRPSIVPLESISRLTHHTLIRLPLSA